MPRFAPRLALLALAISVAVGCFAASALAHVKARDAIATHRYLEARIVLLQASVGKEPRVLGALAALAAKVEHECPRVLAGEPPQVKGEQLSQSRRAISDELLTAVFGVAERLSHPSDVRFERAVRHLKWSKPQITTLVRSLALEQALLSGIRIPDLCADAKFWVASGYTAVSPGTERYLHRVNVASAVGQIPSEPHEHAITFSSEATLAHRLKPYEDRVDRRLARKVFPSNAAKLTGKALKVVIRFLDAVERVDVALGLPAEAHKGNRVAHS